MRWTSRQHLEMAKHLAAKASLATGEKKSRLSGLAAAARLLAEKAMEQERLSLETPEFDADRYRQAVPYLNSGVAHLPPDCVDPLTIVKAIIGYLASIGLDRDEIRYCKPYVKRFTEDMINRHAFGRREVLGCDRQQAAGTSLQNMAEALMMANKDIDRSEGALVKPAEPLKNPPMTSNYTCPSRDQSYRAETLRMAEALFRPSFDAETLLRVTAESNGTIIELKSADGFFGVPFTIKNTVVPCCASQFWTKLDAILAAPFNIERRFGFDGATIKVDCRTPAGSVNFEVWCPESRTQAGRLIGLIYDLARETASAPPAIKRLELLHGYLDR